MSLEQDISQKTQALDNAVKALLSVVRNAEARLAEIPNEIAVLQKKHLIVKAEIEEKEAKLHGDLEVKIRTTLDNEAIALKRLEDAKKKQGEAEVLLAKNEQLSRELSIEKSKLSQKALELAAHEDVIKAKLVKMEELKLAI